MKELEKHKRERISAFSHAPYRIWVVGEGEKMLVTQKEDIGAEDTPYGFYFYCPNYLNLEEGIREEVKIERSESEFSLWLIREGQDYYLFNHKPVKNEEGMIVVEEEIENSDLDLPLFVCPKEIVLEEGEMIPVKLVKI